MRRILLRLAPVLHLTRVTTAFAAVANVWFVILWTRAAAEEPGTMAIRTTPLWLLLLGGATNALGLFTFAAALNDILDIRRDRWLNPERPLVAGRLTIEAALGMAVGTLMIATLGAAALGTSAVLLTLLVACAVLVFHVAGKYVPAVGLVLLGLIYAGQMVVPNLNLRFAWPVWLVMTHSLLVGAAAHRVARKSPSISRRAQIAAAAGWAFWTAVMLYAMWERGKAGEPGGAPGGRLWPEWVNPWTALWPALLALLFVLLSWRRVRVLGHGPRAAEKITRYGALWQALYSCAWLFGEGYVDEGLIVLGLTGVGLLGMTVLREAYALVEHPTQYRR